MIYTATYSVLLFGVPHRGLPVADTRKLMPDLDNPRHALLDQIISDSEHTLSLVGDFKTIMENRQVVTFYETMPTKQLVFVSLPNEGRDGIQSSLENI